MTRLVPIPRPARDEAAVALVLRWDLELVPCCGAPPLEDLPVGWEARITADGPLMGCWEGWVGERAMETWTWGGVE